jgi:hypothetical protein
MEKCGTCKWCDQASGSPVMGFCHWDPPKALVGRDGAQASMLPPVQLEGLGCHNWEAAPLVRPASRMPGGA